MILLTDFIKAIHVTAGISLLAFIMFGLVFIGLKQQLLVRHQQTFAVVLPKLDRFGLIALAVAVLGGTILVPLRHYTYQTPWIEAAYLLLIATGLLLRLNIFLKQKIIAKPTQSKPLRRIFMINCLLVIIMLFLVIHDAVFKSTFLFG